MTSYPITIHTRGTTYSRAGLYALPAGTWTASAVVRKPDGTLIETLAVNFAALSVPDAAGNTHALSVLATATQTALWPLAALLQDVLFTDASTTPVIVPAVTTIITVSAHTAPINEADNPLQTISPDLAPVLRGEQGPAGDAAAGAVTSVAGRTGAVTLAKGDVGLGSVDNTSDASKPVSTAQAAADAAVQAAAAADATSKANAAAAAAVAALGTAAALNVPATGDAAAGEVVKGTDSRLSDARTPTAHTQAASTISDSTATGRAVLTATDAAAARTAIGAGTSSFDGAYASLSGKPTLGTAAATASTDYTPAAHVGAGGTAHANAVAAGAAGFMTGADKSKLDGIATGATVAPTTTDALTEGSANLYHTAARVRAAILTGLSTATATVVSATHTVLEAIGFLQKQVSDNATAITAKQDTLVSGTNIKTVNSTSLLGSGDITVGASIAPLVVEDANTIAQRNGTTAQASYIYNTRTDASNYERGYMRWTANVLEVGCEKGGTGTLRKTRYNLGNSAYLETDESGYVLTLQSRYGLALKAQNTGVAITRGLQFIDSGYDHRINYFANRAAVSALVNTQNAEVWMVGGAGYATRPNATGYSVYCPAGGTPGAANTNGGNGANFDVWLNSGAAGSGTGSAGSAGSLRVIDDDTDAVTFSVSKNGNVSCVNLVSSGSRSSGMAAKTADYTLTLNDHAATFDASGAARTATLPALSTVTAGQEYIVIKIDSSANPLTLDGNAAETINGAASISTTTQWAALRVKANADKSGWLSF